MFNATHQHKHLSHKCIVCCYSANAFSTLSHPPSEKLFLQIDYRKDLDDYRMIELWNFGITSPFSDAILKNVQKNRTWKPSHNLALAS